MSLTINMTKLPRPLPLSLSRRIPGSESTEPMRSAAQYTSCAVFQTLNLPVGVTIHGPLMRVFSVSVLSS